VVFIPEGLSMGGAETFDADRVVASMEELAAIGVTWVSVALPGDTRRQQLASMERFATTVLARTGTA
jgi:hypothetical protein